MYRLLIADDEELVRRGLTALIEREAPATTVVGVAVDGLEALEMARRCNPDVVLTDIRMPGLDGLDLIARLRELAPPPRCIILSGYNEFDYARRAVGLGVADYLLKPVDPDELLSLLARVQDEIAAERRERELRASAEHALIEHAMRRLLNGLGVGGDGQPLVSHLAAAPAWGLLLIQGGKEGDAGGTSESLAALCRAQEPRALVVEDAYGYLCLLLPLPDAASVTLAARADALCRSLRSAGWAVALTVARPCGEPAEIGACYREALGVADYHGSGPGLLRCWEVLPAAERWPALPTTYRDAVLDAVAAGAAADAERAARHFMAYLDEQVSRGARRALWVEMAMLVVHHVQQFGVRADALLDAPHDLRALLTGAGDAEGLEGRFVALVARAADARALLRREPAPRGTIAELRCYIEEHLSDDLTITALARRVNLNGKYLGELFREATGESLGKFIIRTRMRRACDLLAHTSLKVYAIAEQVGYGDPKHFTTMFRTVVGVSPAEYREQHRALPAREVPVP